MDPEPEAVLVSCGLIVAGLMTFVWLLSLVLQRVSIVDGFWGPGFALIAVYSRWHGASSGVTDARTVLALMTVLWGCRLGAHLGVRLISERTEDRRYQAMRVRHGPGFAVTSLWIVFWLQGAVMWLVALPLQTALPRSEPPWSVAGCYAAGLLWATGLFFEAVGDWQLMRFRSRRQNGSDVLRTGLWALTRHPNYFGDFLVWWGLWLFCVNLGSPWWTIISPLVMSAFLIRFSGAGLLERDIADRRPDYAAYVASTNAFFPGWPRARRTQSAARHPTDAPPGNPPP